MKLYPGIFILLFLIDKRYQLILYTFAWVVVLTLLPFLIWPTPLDLYLHQFAEGMQYYKGLMIESYAGVHFGHSLLNSFWALKPDLQIKSILPTYYIFAAILLVLMTGFATFMEKILWKRMAVLAIALCLLPPTSTEYKLLYFFIPFFFFFQYTSTSKTDLLYTLLFSLLFINKGYVYFHGDPFVTLNSILNTFIMIGMLIIIILEHFMDTSIKIETDKEKNISLSAAI